MPRYLLVALIVACASFMENLDATVISTALPAIAADLHEDPIALKLAMTSYLLSLAVFIPISGWAADRFGARTIFCAAIVVFTLGSILCGFSGTLPELIGARIIQGLGGAMMVPVGRLVLLRSVERADLVRALSYLMVPALLGPVTGPIVGGFITTYFHWRWIFWINVPIGILGFTLAMIFIENIREDEAKPLDRSGFLLCGLGLGMLIFGFAGAGRGLVSPLAIALLAGCGGLCLTLYVRHAKRVAHPLIDLQLLAIPTFRASIVGGSLFRIGIGSLPFLLPLMLQIGFGMTPFQSGMVTFISSVGALLMKTTATPILRRFGFRFILIYDVILSAIILTSYGFFTVSTPMLAMMSLLLAGGFFRSLAFTSINAIAYADIDHDRMSQATSFASVAQQLSLSIGIAFAAGILQGLSFFQAEGDPFTLDNFKWGFIGVGLISAASVFVFRTLPQDAGAELASRPQTESAG
nr:DHA2 family efflux MFS transporter permease subunit [Beijerinckia indica]